MIKKVVNDVPTNDRIVRQTELSTILGVSSVTLWRWRQKGEFPAPIKLGSGRMVGWRMSCIQKWIDDRDISTSN